MKKHLSMILVASLLLLCLAGCGATTEETTEGVTINKKYSEETMATVTGEAIDIAHSSFALGATAYGYSMVYPKSWEAIPEMNLYLARDDSVCVASYVPQATVAQLTAMADSEMSDEEMTQANELLTASLVPFAALCALGQEQEELPSVLENYHQSESIASANGYEYVLYYNTDFEREGLAEEDLANLSILADSVSTMKGNILLFPPQNAEASGFEGSLEQFSAKDMDGQVVDEGVFANYELTMVNIWSTWCGYCIEEMDELEALYQKLPANVNMMTICADASEEKALAEDILADNGATFQTLVGNDSLQDTLLQYINSYPSTIFVDKNGTIVGDVQQGAPGRDVLAGYQALIDDRLTLVAEDGGDTAWLKENEKH